MSDISNLQRDEMLSRLKEVAEQLGKQTVSRSEFMRETGISEWHILKHFDSWNDFVQAAGLQPTIVSRIDDDDLFRAMYDAFMVAKGITTRNKFRKVCRYSDDVYRRRWGRWENILATFREWALANAPNFPYLDELPIGPIEQPDITSVEIEQHGGKVSRISKAGRQYGPFLNFRGLQHEPINEQGVVFLFGMVAEELGFIVEGITTGFPDCEAKRDIGKNRWERVQIEFEFESRSFLQHGHDPSQCDLIVCWIHNWPDCPIEVLELRSAIDEIWD